MQIVLKYILNTSLTDKVYKNLVAVEMFKKLGKTNTFLGFVKEQ